MTVAAAPGLERLEAKLDDALEGVIVRPMLTLSDAVDLYLDDCHSRNYAASTLHGYRRVLDQLVDAFPRNWDVSEVREDDIRRFRARFTHLKPGSQATYDAAFRGLFKWLHVNRKIKTNPMEFIGRPRRVPADSLDVVRVSSTDVRRMMAHAVWPTERLAIAVLVYMGPRKKAAAMLRLSDYDRINGRIRFREKGGKVIWKPVPDELAAMLEEAIRDGYIEQPDGYLIPSRGPQHRKGERDHRFLYNLVREVAERAGVRAHVHALRAAFAVQYLTVNPNDIEGLKELMGHRSIGTTERYLKLFNRTQAMERVRGLSWGGNTGSAGAPQIAGKRLGGRPLHALADTSHMQSEDDGGKRADTQLRRGGA